MLSEDANAQGKNVGGTFKDVTFREDQEVTASDEKDEKKEKKKETWRDYNLIKTIANEHAWIVPQSTFASLKPAIRSAVSAWMCNHFFFPSMIYHLSHVFPVLLVVPETVAAIGAFLILMGSSNQLGLCVLR